MTAVVDTEVRRPQPEAPRKRPPLRRRHLLIPLAAAAALIVFTIVAAFVESPSPGSDSFLSPRAVGGDGSSQLAKSLEEKDVTVDRFTDAGDSFFDAASSGDTTVFIPAPDYLNSSEISRLQEAAIAENTRVVFVDPSRDLLGSLGLSEAGAPRIAPKVVAPSEGCDLPEAEKAGDAGMLRQAYAKTKSSGGFELDVDWKFCYDDGLAWTGSGSMSFVVAGAADPFTDEYFGEAGNAELATGLLGQHRKVVWLDKHSLTKEPPPSQTLPTPDGDYTPPPDPSRDPIEYPNQGQTNPIYDAMPAWMWAMLLGALVLGVLMALWKGRRLGPPVTEPLPVTVPAAETVHGRARLYRRAHAYTETLRALRAGALHRIRPVLGLSSQAGDAEVVEAVATRTGWPREHITATLYSTQPTNEDELYNATQAIDALVSAVENASPQGSN